MNTFYLLVNKDPQNSINKKSEPEHTSKMIWNDEVEKDFIKLIKEDKGLWQISNELNKRRSYRYIAWHKIAKEMKALWPNYENSFTMVSCMKKYSNLKKYYIKERKKVKNIPNYVCRWCHFEDLNFLEDNLQTSHGPPVIIQLPDGKRTSSKNGIKKNSKMSSMERKTKTPTIEDSMCNEEESSETSYDNAQSYSDLEEISSKPKKKQLTSHRVPASPDFFNSSQKHQTTSITHDKAFGNFVGEDLGKIPEGIQKEQLRFKIVELIHHCKMDPTYLLD